MIRPLLSVLLVAWFSSAAFASPFEDWQRIPVARTPSLDVTLLLRKVATPADTLFVGWELHNKTDTPLSVANTTSYRLDDVKLSPAGGGEVRFTTSFIRGNDYDLMRREGPPPPEVGFEPPTLPPGITRRLAYASGYGHYVTQLDRFPDGVQLAGRAYFELATWDADLDITGRYATLPEGVPFVFDYLPPDADGEASMRRELSVMLAGPPEGVDDVVYAHHLRRLLHRPTVARVATAGALLDLLGSGKTDHASRSVVVDRLVAHHADDPDMLESYARGLADRGTSVWLRDLADEAVTVTHPSLIDPLVTRAENPSTWSDVGLALQVLARHRALVNDPAALARRLGRVALERAPASFRDGAEWHKPTVKNLLHAGDPATADVLAPFLDDDTSLYSIRDLSLLVPVSNGLPIRVKDEAANAALDLLVDDETPRASVYAAVDDEAAELARRDAVVAELRDRLSPTMPK